MVNYEVVKAHRSNYPQPITLARGQAVTLGERYDGPENWNNWVYCSTTDPAQKGWVPEQLIEPFAGEGADPGRGRMHEDYTARELTVDPGDRVTGLRELNGWVWCEKAGHAEARSRESGWVPKDNLKPLP